MEGVHLELVLCIMSRAFAMSAAVPCAISKNLWYGPIVMNTQEQLRRAFDELEAGMFSKRAALSM
jgi:redox-sensitive bicupin YhaK (pirin superfamily)